nr:polyprotein [Barley yellow mosaic virus]
MSASSSRLLFDCGSLDWPNKSLFGDPTTRDVMDEHISSTWNAVIRRHMLAPNADAETILGRDGLPSAQFDAYGAMLPSFIQALNAPTTRLRISAPLSTAESILCADASHAPWLYMANSVCAYEATHLQPVQTFIAFNFAHGYCYLSLFIPLSFRITFENARSFSRFLEQLPDILGAYPTLAAIYKTMLFAIRLFPEVLQAPIPIIAKRPGVLQFHVSDARGLPPSWFPMKCGSVASFVALITNNLNSDLLNGIVGSNGDGEHYTNWNSGHDHWIVNRFITVKDLHSSLKSALEVDLDTEGGRNAVLDLLLDLGVTNLVRREKRFPAYFQGAESVYLLLSCERVGNELVAVQDALQEPLANYSGLDLRALIINLGGLPSRHSDICYTRNIFENDNHLVWNFEFYRIASITKNAQIDRDVLSSSMPNLFSDFVSESTNGQYRVKEPRPVAQYRVEHDEPVASSAPSAWWQVLIGITTAILGAIIFFLWRCFLRAKRVKFQAKDSFPWFTTSGDDDSPPPPGDSPSRPPGRSPDRVLPRTVVRDLSFNDDDDLHSVDLNEAGSRFGEVVSLIARGNLRELAGAIPESLSNLTLLQTSASGSGFYTMVALYLATLGDAITAFHEHNDASPATIQSLRTLELQLEARGLRFNEAGTPANLIQRGVNSSVGRALVRLTQSALLATGENFRTRMATTLERIAAERLNTLTAYDQRVIEMTTELLAAIKTALEVERSELTPHLANAEALLQVYNNLFSTDYASASLLALRREMILRSAEGRVGEQPTSASDAANEELVQRSMTKLDKEIELFQAQIDSQRRAVTITEASNLRENILQPINTVANIAMAGAFLRGGARHRMPGMPDVAAPMPNPFRAFSGRGHSLTTTRGAGLFRRPRV